jgi:hypothetical protein
VNKIPAPFWAVVLAAMGTGVAVAVLYHPTPENIGLAVLTIGSNLVSGALGAFAGHAAAKADVTDNGGGVTINQTDPK